MDLAIVQLASWGDVVLSTCIVDAIKKQRPNWSITFYVSSACSGAVFNNPNIDNLFIVNASKAESFQIWGDVANEARRRHEKVIIPWAGILPESNWRLLNGDVPFGNFMWAYPRAIQDLGLKFAPPITTYLYPEDHEINKVKQYASGFNDFILMEIHGESCQTQWTDDWTRAVIKSLSNKYHIIISNKDIPGYLNKYVKDGFITVANDLSLREVSVLFNYSKAFIGVSSGTSNACHTHLCKKNNYWLEVVNNRKWDSSPMGRGNQQIYYGQLDGLLPIIKGKFSG